MEETWHGVRDRVSRLQDLQGAGRTFASFAHGFELAPSLSESEVEDAERAFDTRLPDDYRGFLLHVGAGGAGPAYGVLRLRRAADAWEWAADSTHRTDTDRLAEPFAPQHINGSPIDPLSLRVPNQYDFEYRDDYEVAHRRWEETVWHPGRTAGAICLCDEGCLRRYWLVVTGDERGTVWRDYRVDAIDLAPLIDAHGRRLTFARWYLGWLNELEEQAKSVERIR
ncbi:SMI1/KNR4 family protein [Micromonospora deserti]|nr:SMI1/KNR4 family protein [Micromonospora deserti]